MIWRADLPPEHVGSFAYRHETKWPALLAQAFSASEYRLARALADLDPGRAIEHQQQAALASAFARWVLGIERP